MELLNIDPDLAWGSDFDLTPAVISFSGESIGEIVNALRVVEVDPIGRVIGDIPEMPNLKAQYEAAKKTQLEHPGFCVFNGIQDHLDPDLWGAAYRVFAPVMGRVIGQDRIDQTILDRISVADQKKYGIELGHHLEIKSVSDKGGDFSDRWRYSDGTSGGNMHTDGVERPENLTPKYFGFVVRKTSREGGKSWLVSVPRVYERLRESDSESLKVLHDDFHFSLKGDRIDDKDFTTKPILYKSGERGGFDTVGAQYLRHYIAQGHKLAREPLTPVQLKALDAFDRELEHPKNVLESDYVEGGFYVLNNHHVLHGRTAYKDAKGDRKRELLRVWVV